MRDYMTKFSTLLGMVENISTPGLTILSCNRFNQGHKLFMSHSNMCGNDYLSQENKMEAFLLPGINAENVEHFNPGVEIVHVIGEKNQPG
jgi:hypothetical protein